MTLSLYDKRMPLGIVFVQIIDNMAKRSDNSILYFCTSCISLYMTALVHERTSLTQCKKEGLF